MDVSCARCRRTPTTVRCLPIESMIRAATLQTKCGPHRPPTNRGLKPTTSSRRLSGLTTRFRRSLGDRQYVTRLRHCVQPTRKHALAVAGLPTTRTNQTSLRFCRMSSTSVAFHCFLATCETADQHPPSKKATNPSSGGDADWCGALTIAGVVRRMAGTGLIRSTLHSFCHPVLDEYDDTSAYVVLFSPCVMCTTI